MSIGAGWALLAFVSIIVLPATLALWVKLRSVVDERDANERGRDHWKSQAECLSEANASLYATIATLEAKAAEHLDALARANERAAKAEEDAEQWRRNHAKVCQQIDTLEAERDQARNEAGLLASDRDHWRTKAETAESNWNVTNDAMKIAAKRNGELKAEAAEWKAKADEYGAKLEDAKAAADVYQSTIAREVETLRAERDQWREAAIAGQRMMTAAKAALTPKV